MRRAWAYAALVLLAGCGGGADKDPQPVATVAAPTATVATVAPPSPTPSTPSTPKATATPARPTPTPTGRAAGPAPAGSPLADAVDRYMQDINNRRIPELCAEFAKAAPPACHGGGSPPVTLDHLELSERPQITRRGRYALAQVAFVAVDANGQRTLMNDVLVLRRTHGIWAVARPSEAFAKAVGSRTG